MPGSGKSTIAEKLSGALGMKRYYIGSMRREMARRRGMTLEEFNKLGETDPSTDKDVDDYQIELSKSEDNIIIEGRTSFFLVPKSLKLFVDVDPNEGAARILNELHDSSRASSRNEAIPDTLEDMKLSLHERLESDRKRYKKYYGIEDAYDKRHFDIIIDTTGRSPEESFKAALDAVSAYQCERENPYSSEVG